MSEELNIEAIKKRLADRRKPQIGTCSKCGHQQEMATPGMAYASSMAEAMWRCQKCGGSITVLFTTTTGPYVDDDLHDLIAEIERLRAALGSRGVPQDLSAGDLLIDASNKFAEHAEICNLDDCSECTVRINQLRLARKVWQSSAHKSAALPSSPAEKV